MHNGKLQENGNRSTPIHDRGCELFLHGLKPLSPSPVLGMTLHRKSVQPVGSPRSPPTHPPTSWVWAQTEQIKVTLHSHCSPWDGEPLPPTSPLHPLSLVVSLQGFVTLCYT